MLRRLLQVPLIAWLLLLFLLVFFLRVGLLFLVGDGKSGFPREVWCWSRLVCMVVGEPLSKRVFRAEHITVLVRTAIPCLGESIVPYRRRRGQCHSFGSKVSSTETQHNN